MEHVKTWSQLVRFQRVALTAMDQHLRDAFGQTLDDYDVLHQVGLHDGPIRMGELAERLLVANSSCHRIVGRLVSAGLLERSHGERDGRVVLVALTSEGKRLRRRMAAVHARDIETLFGRHLSGNDLEQLDVILGRLLDASSG